MTVTALRNRPLLHPGRGAWAAHRALVNNTASLLGTTGVTSLLGFVFWWVAARLLPVSMVGYGSAAVSAMMLVGTFAMIGLNTVLIGQLARHPRNAAGLVSASLCTSAVAGVAFGAVFVGVGVIAVPRIAPYLAGAAHIGVFLAGCALTAATLVLDEALIGILLGGIQLWRNTAFAVLKLAALAGLILVVHDRLGLGILQAWVLGTALSLAPVIILLRRRGVEVMAAPDWSALRRLGTVTASHTWLNNALQAPRFALPLVVTGLVSAEASGAFYVALMIATLLQLVPHHFSTVLYAIGASDRQLLRDKLRFSLRASLLIGLVGVPLVVVLARPVLRLYGPVYANDAAFPLQVLVIGYFGSVIKNHYIALCRVHEEIARAARFATAACVARLAAAAAGAVVAGVTGLAVGGTLIMCLEGLVTLPPVLHALCDVPRGRHAPGAASPWSGRHLDPSARPGPRGTRTASVPETTGPAPAQPIRVCYYLQTHNLPDQLLRLVQVIKTGSPRSVVLISHDQDGPPLDIRRLEAMGGVHVLLERGGYGDFSHLQRYFTAIDWLADHKVSFDWLENITGQDYPIRPIPEIEHFLATADADAFLLHAPVFEDELASAGVDSMDPEFRLCSSRGAQDRYLYRYWRVGRPTARKQRWLRPLWIVNFLQPWLRVNLSFSAIGVRRRTTPFSADFYCYGGWFFGTLSSECACYVREFARNNPDIVKYFQGTLAPEETFLQTVLVNAGTFRLDTNVRRYIDMRGSRHGHSKTLGLDDLDEILASGAHWARKVNMKHDPRLLDAIDAHRGPTPAGLG